MITSPHNPKIQFVRSLLERVRARRDAQAFVVEGVRLVEEAFHAEWDTQLVLFTDDLSLRGRAVVEAFVERGVKVEPVTSQVLKSVSDTETPQGILAVLDIKPLPLPSKPDFILILDALRDPGNLGTILRTASSAKVQAVLLPPGVTDPYAPKVVRSAMGAHFRMPIRSLPWADIQAYLKPVGSTIGPCVYLADAQGGSSYTQADFQSPLALLVGGEAEGAGIEAQSLANTRLHIPMPGQAESLNAAAAAAILMFEFVRQRSVHREDHSTATE